jgi:hypothetical protein
MAWLKLAFEDRPLGRRAAKHTLQAGHFSSGKVEDLPQVNISATGTNLEFEPGPVKSKRFFSRVIPACGNFRLARKAKLATFY